MESVKASYSAIWEILHRAKPYVRRASKGIEAGQIYNARSTCDDGIRFIGWEGETRYDHHTDYAFGYTVETSLTKLK